MIVTELRVRRDDLAAIAAASREVEPAAGQALFRVEHFALTANNMTYAAHGLDMGYWNFFPAPEGSGIVPVWGFASVVQSRAERLVEGARFYGYWPMASHALLTPAKLAPRGFVDSAPHRQALPPVYNGYVPASDAFGAEALQAIFRPLYTTSFVLDLMLADSPAEILLLTSASSKTALGLAQLAKGRQWVIGLTSSANRDFVVATGYYDEVLDYADITAVGGAGPVALVDFSGNGAVRHAIHSGLGERLIESHIVGDTHWDAAHGGELPGVRPKGFFAPTVIVERVQAWGAAGFEARLAAAWAGFIATTGWLSIVEGSGAEVVAGHWREVAAGRMQPAQGLVLSV